MLRRGKKTKAWDNARRKLKKIFESKGITTCELQLPGCRFDNSLGFMHRSKRRKITDDQELMTVCLSCNPCHAQVESLSADAMYRTVTDIIEQRGVRQ